VFLAAQVAPRNFKLIAVSPYCVSLSYDHVLYPNGPESGLVYQVKATMKIVIDDIDCKYKGLPFSSIKTETCNNNQ